MIRYTSLMFSAVLFLASLSSPAAQGASQENDPRITPVVRAYRAVAPTVVNISTTKVVRNRLGIFGSDPFDDIFPNSPLTRKVPVHNLGSGFVIHPDGYIITNAHVVRRAQQITVRMTDKSKFPAKVISADPQHDLAVLKVNPSEGKPLPWLELGRSDNLLVGEPVIAIGNPLGYSNTVTTGVVSAVGRTLHFPGDITYTDVVQTDAPINPGSSGGPLLNINGELIGINTAIRADAQNIGFAIPIDALTRDLCALLDFEHINRVIFGAKICQQFSGSQRQLTVSQVRADSPAEGKLLPGDVIKSIDGAALDQIADYACSMLAVEGGQTVEFGVVRDGSEQVVPVTLRNKPKPNGKQLAIRLFGMRLREVGPQLAEDLGLPSEKGLLVVGLDADGPARKLGIRIKDMLIRIDRYYVETLDQLGTILEEVQPGQQVKIGIRRGWARAYTKIQARTDF